MANNRVVVNFDFKANIGDVQSNLSALKNNLLQIQTIGSNSSSFLGVNQGLKQASIAAQQLQTHLAGAINPFTKQLDLSMFSKSLQGAGLNVTQLSNSLLGAGATGQQAFKNLALTIASAQAPALQLSATMGKLMTTFANNARWMLSSSVLTGFISGVREAVDYTKDLNESLTDIRIVTGKSKEDMDNLARSANKMAKELKTSTAEIVKGQLIYYQQGDSAALAAKKAEITTKAANISFGSSQEQMSEYLTAIWNSYQVGEEHLEQFVDVLAAVGATTATSMEEIATAMQKVAATGNAVGVSYEQLTATIATISSVTRTSSEQVGTALKTIYARIGDLKAGGLDEDDIGLGQVSAGLKKVGVEILDTNNNIRDMGEVVEEIGTKWEAWTEAQQQAIVQLIAGKRQYTQMMALFENWDMYESTLATAEGADGELNKQQEIWAESWEAASQNVQASLESIYTKIFDDDVFIDLLNTLNGVIVTFDTLTEAFGGIGPILMQIGALIMHHFKVPIVDALVSVRHGFDILTGNAQRAHEQMRNQFFQGIDFSQMDAGLKMEIQSLGQLTEVQDQYKLNMSQIHKSERLQIENSIEIAQALRNQALAQQEVADKQKQSISNTIAASKASVGTKQTARNNLEEISSKAIQAEMARNTLKSTFQDKTGKFNPSAALNKSGKTATDEDRGEFLARNQEKFNAVLQQTESALQKEITKNKEIIALNEKKLNQEKLINAEQKLQSFEQGAKGQRRDELINKQNNGGLTKTEEAELKKLNQEYGVLKGNLTKITNTRQKAIEVINREKTALNQNEKELAKTRTAMNIIKTAMDGGSVSSDKFKQSIELINKSLKNGTVSQDAFSEQFREIGASLGLTGTQLDAFVKEILEMISNTATANMSQEEFQRQLQETADRLRGAGNAASEASSKINADSLMNAASAMMSMSSAASAITDAFKTFGEEGASATDIVTAGTGAITQGIFAITMAMKMLQGANPWIIGITIALSALPMLMEGLDALIVTQEEKLENLEKEAEELTEKYNEQKSIVDELESKKEAGVDNQAQLDALDEEIKREKIKLDYIEKQNKAKNEEKTEQEIRIEEDKYKTGGSAVKKTEKDLSTAENQLFNDIAYSMTLDGQEEFQKIIEAFKEGRISFQEIRDELQNNSRKYFGPEVADDYVTAAIEGLSDISKNTENNLQENLESLELFTKNGVKLTDEFLNTFKQNLHAVYGDTLGPDAIQAISAYYSNIDKLSDKELQSLLEVLFPEEDKDKLVDRFKQGLQEINGEMDKFGKKETLAKSLENAGKAIDKVQSALKEIDDIGFVSYSTIEEIGVALDKAGVASGEWKQALYDANGNAEKTKEVLGRIANEIANATVEAQKFSENLHFNDDGSLTTESQEYTKSVENMIAAQLRSNGVQNAAEVAHKKVQTQILKAKIANGDLNKSVDEITKSYLAEANAIGLAEEELRAYILTEKMYDPSATVSDILKVANTFLDIALGAGLAAGAIGEYNRMVRDSAAHEVFDESGNPILVPGTEYTKDDWLNVTEKIRQEVFNFKGFSVDDIEVTDIDPDDSGGKNDPQWKIDYETNISKAKLAASKEGWSDEMLGKHMRHWWSVFVALNQGTIKDEKTGETWEQYAYDEEKKAIDKIKSGIQKAFDNEIKDIERHSDGIDYQRVINVLTSVKNKTKEYGVSFSTEETQQLIDDYVGLIDGILGTASSDLSTKFQNQEFFSGTVEFDTKIQGYNDLITTAQLYLQTLKDNQATTKQIADFENSQIIPLIKAKRDIIKEQAEAEHEAYERYKTRASFYGYENGDNEIKAAKRYLNKKLSLTEEEILAEYGSYKEYSYAMEDLRIEFHQLVRERLKEALEQEKELNIARMESKKILTEGEFEIGNKIRESRRNINQKLQESLIMYQYLDKATKKLIFNEEDYLALNETLNEIEQESADLQKEYLQKIATAEIEDLEYINSEYERQNELLMKKYEIAEKELEVAKARTELENTLKERNTQMFINGSWQWVANQNAVIEAQKKLNDAEFEAESKEIEQKQELAVQAIDRDIDKANLTWNKAVSDLEDKTMTVTEIMSSFSSELDAETKQFMLATSGYTESMINAINNIIFAKGQHEQNNTSDSWAYLDKMYNAAVDTGVSQEVVDQLKGMSYKDATLFYGKLKERVGTSNLDPWVQSYQLAENTDIDEKGLTHNVLKIIGDIVNNKIIHEASNDETSWKNLSNAYDKLNSVDGGKYKFLTEILSERDANTALVLYNQLKPYISTISRDAQSVINEIIYKKGIHEKENTEYTWSELSKQYDILSLLDNGIYSSVELNLRQKSAADSIPYYEDLKKIVATPELSLEALDIINEIVYKKGIHEKENTEYTWSELSAQYEKLSKLDQGKYSELVEAFERRNYDDSALFMKQLKEEFIESEVLNNLQLAEEETVKNVSQSANDLQYILDNPELFGEDIIKAYTEGLASTFSLLGANNLQAILQSGTLSNILLVLQTILKKFPLKIENDSSTSQEQSSQSSSVNTNSPASVVINNGGVQEKIENVPNYKKYLAHLKETSQKNDGVWLWADDQEKQLKALGYAKGTRSALQGLHKINEIGEETFVTPDGHFRNFTGGEVVFTHEQSQKLFSLLNSDLFNLKNISRVGDFEQSNSNDTYISIGGISIDTSSQDGQDLVNILQRLTYL